jgi:tRNA pseudouridine synthase 10
LEISDKALELLTAHPLCDNCLGRQFALLGYGLSNNTRGKTLKLLLTMKNHQLALSGINLGFSNLRILGSNGNFGIASEILKNMRKRGRKRDECYLCKGQFNNLDIFVKDALELLEEYEYTTFLVGIELPNSIEEKEDELKAKFEIIHGESMRNEFSREIGKKITFETNKIADYKKPDIVIIVNPFNGSLNLQSNPLYIRGDYKKLVRYIPQSKWFCRNCNGLGCENCKGTGKMYQESVEELIGGPILEISKGEDIAFHAAGREDVDARMLGTGRPFILEVKRPKKRFLNLKNLTEIINKQAENKVQVLNLSLATKKDIKSLKKAEGSTKIYKVTIDFERVVSDEELNKISKTLTKIKIQQKTPNRVLHRRADLVREKYIYETHIKRLAPKRAEMKIRCQGGLYIKELVSGDLGRTVPSVASIINIEAKPLKLDVLKIIMEEK